VAGFVTSATYQSRYAAVVVPLVLLAVAVGITGCPTRPLLVGLVYVGCRWSAWCGSTTTSARQAAVVGAALAADAKPGDLVVFCPDQLGPDYSRAMPAGLRGVSFPALGSPERVDWVDYADRNAAADPPRWPSASAARPTATPCTWCGCPPTSPSRASARPWPVRWA
jgi:hypothetical protein